MAANGPSKCCVWGAGTTLPRERWGTTFQRVFLEPVLTNCSSYWRPAALGKNLDFSKPEAALDGTQKFEQQLTKSFQNVRGNSQKSSERKTAQEIRSSQWKPTSKKLWKPHGKRKKTKADTHKLAIQTVKSLIFPLEPSHKVPFRISQLFIPLYCPSVVCTGFHLLQHFYLWYSVY